MSNLPFHPRPIPASIPITTRGNAFWRDGERFFVKGISYSPRTSTDERGNLGTPIDPLCDGQLPELEQDMDFVLDLGLNSISIYHIDHHQSHAKAMKYLEEKGIYVMIPLCANPRPPKAHFESSRIYDLDLIMENFRLVHEMAQYPNTLGFIIGGHGTQNATTSNMSQVLRACIRDTKAFLQLIQPARTIPLGVSFEDSQREFPRSIQYFSAGSSDSGRADFLANQCYSWAGPSSFEISGWNYMVETVAQNTRIPMLLAEYGANVGWRRPWDEVSCLYSPDMTGVYSGGFAYTLLESNNGYGVVEIDKDTGRRRQKSGDYSNLKRRFAAVNQRSAVGTANEEVRTYEDWIAGFSHWSAGHEIPPFPGNWEEVLRHFPPLSYERPFDETEPSVNSIRRDLDILSLQSTTTHLRGTEYYDWTTAGL